MLTLNKFVQMKFIFYGILLLTFSFSACEKKVEGCMHPRAENFNPEADENMDCKYYELTLAMQHFANTIPNDTLSFGKILYDANNEPFFLTKMDLLGGEMHLIKAGTNDELKSPESVPFYNTNGTAIYVEDNFFISKLEQYSYNIAGWTELGDFDRLRFHIGIPDVIRQTDPSKVEETNHPLSTSAVSYMFDSTSMSYITCKMVIEQATNNNTFEFIFFDYLPIELPYTITAKDGEAVPIRLRLDYVNLFNGISFTNDSQSIIKDKIVQNFATSFSSY